MQKPSNSRTLSAFLTFAFLTSISPSTHSASSVQPSWVKTFGQVEAGSFDLKRYSELMRLARRSHVDSEQNESLARIWQFNGILPLLGDGYYLLSRESTEELGFECLREILSNSFCLTNYSKFASIYNDESLGEAQRKKAKLQTQSLIQNLKNSDRISDLHSELDATEAELFDKTPSHKRPPLDYQFLAKFKGYLEGLDPHSTILLADDLKKFTVLSKQNNDDQLLLSKKDQTVTIKFTSFFKEISPEQSLYYRITNFLDQNLEEDDRIIVDLRGNGGGYTQTSLRLAQVFLPPTASNNTSFLNTFDKNSDTIEPKETYTDFVPSVTYDKNPMIVLVDENTASASEIFASILQSQKRALIVGHKTYGKGSVQDIVGQIGDSLFLKLTVKFFAVRGARSPQNRGVIPDVEFAQTEEQEMNSLYESELPNSLEPQINEIQQEMNLSSPLLTEASIVCAKMVSSKRGQGPLKNIEEIQTISHEIFDSCFGMDEKNQLGIKR